MINKKQKKGFTLLEVIFVIIVIGIISITAMNSMERHLRSKTIDTVISAFRYTKHLALIDNKMNPKNELWQKTLWTIGFKECNGKPYIYIGSDMNLNGIIEKSEAAGSSVDNKLYYSNENICNDKDSSPSIFIGKDLDVSSVVFSGCDSETDSVSFDYLGRPHTNINDIEESDYKTLIKKDCIIEISFNSEIEPIILRIRKETGFISVDNRNKL